MGLALGMVLAVVLVAWILHPLVARRHTPTAEERFEE